MKARTVLATLAVTVATITLYAQGGPPQGGGPGGPPRGGQGFGGPGGPGGMNRGLPPIEMLVFRHDVQADIHLTDAQRTKLDALRQSIRPPGGSDGFGGPPRGGPGFGGPGGQGGPPPQDGPRFGGRGGQDGPGGGPMDEQRKKNEAAVEAILTSQQLGRVKEIGIQLAGAHAILDKNVQTQLALTDEQKGSLAALVKAEQAAMRDQFDQMRDGGNGDPRKMRETMDKHREAFDAKLKAVLTAEQASHLAAMSGKAFQADEEERFGGPPPPPPGGGD